MRLDTYLHTKLGLESRNKAKQLILSGAIQVNSVVIKKVSHKIVETDVVEQISSLRFVSRGGHKLEAALSQKSIDIHNLVCIDVGASTGGFTDCMIKHGAQKVLCIDVGTNQLHPSLRTNPRVMVLENTDIRNDVSVPFLSDFLAVDLSFISITLCLDNIQRLMKPQSKAVFLIKPQFEAGLLGYKRDYIPLGKIRDTILKHCSMSITQSGFTILDTLRSPISGAKKGNIEELIIVEKK